MEFRLRLLMVLLLAAIMSGCGARDSASRFENVGSALPDPDDQDLSGDHDDEPMEDASEDPGFAAEPFDALPFEVAEEPPMEESAQPSPMPSAVVPGDGDETAAPLPPRHFDVPRPPPDGSGEVAHDVPVSEGDYALEKIYYGTDRAPEVTSVDRWEDYRTAWRRTKVCAAIGLLFCAGAVYVDRRRVLLIVPAVVSLLVSGWFGRTALLEKQRAEFDDFSSNLRYGDSIHFVDGKHTLERGYCWVSIPVAVHERGSGELEEPGLFEVSEDPNRHFTLRRVESDDRDSFLADFRRSVGESEEKHAFVFIHGYNVLFREAALRTAQLKYDLDFDGPAALFSWPSNGSLLSYATDEETVNLTVRSGVLNEFLSDLMQETGAESIHLIAHSMGNRALTRAFEQLPDVKNSDGQPVINQFIMAAPDVNPAEFRLLSDRIKQLTRSRTLYASDSDIALIGSEILRRSAYTRLGQGGDLRVILEGIQTIDASDLEQPMFDLGHSYYVHPLVIQDLRHLLRATQSELPRSWLLQKDNYWTFRQD